MKISKSKVQARLKAAQKQQGKPSSIRFMRQVGEGLLAFRQDKRAILTTSDDELPTVIGECNADDLSNIPPSLNAWIVESEREVRDYQAKPKPKAIIKVKEAVTGDAEPTKGRVSIEPLIKATWNQGAPYNQNLKFDGESVIVGCNAVAIGMILEYYGHKGFHRGCKKTTAYTARRGYKVPALPPVTVFDYANLTTGKPSTPAQKAAVADMLKHIGYALKSNYAPDVTTAAVANIVTVLAKSLKFGNPKRIYAAYGYSYFEQAIYDELAAGRPVIMVGYAPSGSGHTFICDGYNAATDMYHFNWGWGGSCNGYFRMSALDITSARAYNSNKQAIIGIAPTYKLGDVNGDGEVTITDAMQVVELAAQGSTNPQADINSDGKVTAADANIIIDHVIGTKKL